MGIFKRSINHSKSSNLDEKLKTLELELKKTDVTVSETDRNFLHEQKNKSGEVVKYSWRDGNNVSEKDSLVEEISLIRDIKDSKSTSSSLKNVKGHLSFVEQEIDSLKKEIFNEISENFLFNIPSIEKKVDKVLTIYNSIQEGLLNEPPETKNKDPLTPLNQTFVTPEDLNKHYTLFINRIQEQLATLGGGGETRLKYLDDVVGIATNAGAYDGKLLSYNHTLGKFEFVGSASGIGIGISIGESPPTDTATYPLWFDSRYGRTFVYYSDQDGNQWVDLAPSTSLPQSVGYASTAGISTVSQGLTGTPNINVGVVTATKVNVQGGDIRVGVNTSNGLILSSPNGSQFRLIVDNAGNLSTVLVP